MDEILHRSRWKEALLNGEQTSSSRKLVQSTLILAASFALLYWRVGLKLVHDWASDDNYSHGFLIVPLAAYFAWERRARLRRLPIAPESWGLPLVGGSLAVLMVGSLGAELFLTRIAMIGTLAGGILFVLGRQHLRVLLFPLGLLLLMIPVPAILFNQVVFPLQLLASRVGEAALSAAGVPVLREGNVIILAHTSLEVAEACSGIRSLVSLLTLCIVCGYFVDPRPGVRSVIALSSIPVAIIANGLRVAGTGLAAHFFSPAVARGFFHTFSGWLVFAFAFVLLFGVVRTIQSLHPAAPSVPRLSGSTA